MPRYRYVIRYRSAVTGRFVTEAFAKRNATMTVMERRRVACRLH